MIRILLTLVTILVCDLCISSESEDDKKLKMVLDMGTVKTAGIMIHDNFDRIFDKKIVKSKLKDAPPKLISDFRHDYEISVDKYLSVESIEYNIAFHLSKRLTLEQLKSMEKFYGTSIGLRLKKNITDGISSAHGFSKDELAELAVLYKSYGMFDMLEFMPEVMSLWKKGITDKVDNLRLDYNALEAEYLLKTKI
jgi:hypothetical protein